MKINKEEKDFSTIIAQVKNLNGLREFLNELKACGTIRWSFDEQQADPINKFWRDYIPNWSNAIKVMEELDTVKTITEQGSDDINTLQSCPFCGGNDIEVSADKKTKENGHVWCNNPECEGIDVYAKTKEEVIKLWNRRP